MVLLVVRSYQPVVVAKVVGVPVPPTLVVPVYEVPAMTCVAVPPEMKILPQRVLARSFHSVSASVESADLPNCIRTRPPALKKYRA